MPMRDTSRAPAWLLLAWIVLLAASRFWLAETVPLTDRTEARFAEMARKMVETQDWLVPQYDYGVPYLAKPPLATWLSALGIKVLGPTQFAPRALIFVISLLFCAAYWRWLSAMLGSVRALLAVGILMSSAIFYISMAAAMTDMILVVSVALALMAFWRRYHGGSWRIELAMSVALAVGVLTKGPLALVLFYGPILIWSIWLGLWREVWQRIAWLRSVLVILALAAPWYLAAQWRNPEFFEYFIVGEHFGRFLVPEWSGDLYGRAHDMPRGTIWLFLLIGLLPWPILILPPLIRSFADVRARWREQRELVIFALCWALAPVLLFSASANIILPYALPAVPGAAILFSIAICTHGDAGRQTGRIALTASAIAIAIVIGIQTSTSFVAAHTQEPVIAAVRNQGWSNGEPLYYWRMRFFSAEYYSEGAARRVKDLDELDRILASDPSAFVVTRSRAADAIKAQLGNRVRVAAELNGFTLFGAKTDAGGSKRRRADLIAR